MEPDFNYKQESIDPQIKPPQLNVSLELESLNHASVDINRLEVDLDEARGRFHSSLTETKLKLDALSKKLGQHIERARPYYEARRRAKDVQADTQRAALRFERAINQQTAAREMVALAEQGFFRVKGQEFDPAWQEMLNHATIKVNEAEMERCESERIHRAVAKTFSEMETSKNALYKANKSSINKSRAYFETKAKCNQQLEEHKHRVGNLERLVKDAKARYSRSLNSLEQISNNIHAQRRDERARAELGSRGAGVGAEQPADERSDAAQQRSSERVDVSHAHPLLPATGQATPVRNAVAVVVDGQHGVTQSPDEPSRSINAEIMANLQRVKPEFLRLNRSYDRLSDFSDDIESLASVSMLDDEQVEAACMEPEDYEQYLRGGDEGGPRQELPARLGFLRDMVLREGGDNARTEAAQDQGKADSIHNSSAKVPSNAEEITNTCKQTELGTDEGQLSQNDTDTAIQNLTISRGSNGTHDSINHDVN